jgi:hypothetical protein
MMNESTEQKDEIFGPGEDKERDAHSRQSPVGSASTSQIGISDSPADQDPYTSSVSAEVPVDNTNALPLPVPTDVATEISSILPTEISEKEDRQEIEKNPEEGKKSEREGEKEGVRAKRVSQSALRLIKVRSSSDLANSSRIVIKSISPRESREIGHTESNPTTTNIRGAPSSARSNNSVNLKDISNPSKWAHRPSMV